MRTRKPPSLLFGRRIQLAAGGLLLAMSLYTWPCGAEDKSPDAPKASDKRLGAEQPQRVSEAAESLREKSAQARRLYATGEYAAAAEQMTAALAIAREHFGPAHRESLNCLNNLAMIYSAQGELARAQQMLQSVVDHTREQFDDDSPQYALAVNNLGGVCQALGDFDRAASLFTTALVIRRQALGPAHDDTLTSLNNLAGLDLKTGKLEAAHELFSQIVAARRSSDDATGDRYAESLTNLAAACESLDRLDEAERLYREALSIQEQSLGRDHPAVAASCNNLGLLLSARGRREEAERLLLRALRSRAQTLGEAHPEFAASLNNLAVHYRRQGEYETAAAWYRRALEAQQRVIRQTCCALPQRQQLLLLSQLRRTLDGYLSVAPHTEAPIDEVYGHVLKWKGLAFARQWALRRAPENQAAARRLAQLRVVSGQLAALTFAPADSDHAAQRRRRLAELTGQCEHLEAELARAGDDAGWLAPASVDEVRSALPKDVALVDFLEYWRSAPPPGVKLKAFQPRREQVAFVVRRGGAVARVDLADAETIANQIETWRRTSGAPGKGADAGARLRASVWEPILQRAGAAKTILISPDGALARLPFGALPGKRRGEYVIEEHALAVLPVPQLLPAILAQSAQRAEKRPARGLLLLGDIDYGSADAADEDTNAPTGAQPAFARLSSSRSEILAVRDSFEHAFGEEDVLTLRRKEASEARFVREAPRHRYLHLATHGFFAPLAARGAGGASPAIDPGSLSGLALSDANRRPMDVADDGILTAAEVAALDLRNVDLAVLSACETGLGEIAAGEGVLGLQRSFQVAGAGTVVASLWKVEDRATRELMERFYENLWNADRPMSKAEALRRAQLALLREARARGVSLVAAGGEKASAKRSPPYYWAAFVLSGDWR